MEGYDNEIIKGYIHTKWIGHDIVYEDIVSSTNELCKQLAIEGCPKGLLVFSDKQSNGKGSHGRRWESPSGSGIWATIYIGNDYNINQLAELNLLLAYSIVKVLNDYCNIDAKIKWPNDVYINGKKVSGILAEAFSIDSDKNSVVIGFGINVNQVSFDESIENIAISLFQATGKLFDRGILLGNIVNKFEKTLNIYMKNYKNDELKQELNNYLMFINEEVYISRGAKKEVVLLKHINEDGSLSVVNSFGKKEKICVGEIRIDVHRQ